MRRFIQPRDRTREKHVAVNAEAPVKVTCEPCREHPDPGAFTVGTRSFPFRFRQLSDRDLYPTIHAPRQHQIRILVQIAESGPTQPRPPTPRSRGRSATWKSFVVLREWSSLVSCRQHVNLAAARGEHFHPHSFPTKTTNPDCAKTQRYIRQK